MKKSSKAPYSPARENRGGAKVPSKFVDRLKQIFNSAELQFPPTDAQPVPQRYKMAGGS